MPRHIRHTWVKFKYGPCYIQASLLYLTRLVLDTKDRGPLVTILHSSTVQNQTSTLVGRITHNQCSSRVQRALMICKAQLVTILMPFYWIYQIGNRSVRSGKLLNRKLQLSVIDIGTLGGQIRRKWNSEEDLEMLCLEKTEHCNSEKDQSSSRKTRFEAIL